MAPHIAPYPDRQHILFCVRRQLQSAESKGQELADFSPVLTPWQALSVTLVLVYFPRDGRL